MGSPEKILVQKYENWLDSIQEPIMNIQKILLEVYSEEINIELKRERMMPDEIRECLLRAYDLLINFRNEIQRKTTEVFELRDEIKRLDSLLKDKQYNNDEFPQRRNIKERINKEQFSSELKPKRGMIYSSL